ncbi:MAG: hypothetical protein KY476_21755 [Planctomycetes bacterium]|nr:hypothetical protein [Planctomycetota bacterium]
MNANYDRTNEAVRNEQTARDLSAEERKLLESIQKEAPTPQEQPRKRRRSLPVLLVW